MDKNYILHNFLNGSATAEEIAQLKEDPEFAAYVKISEATPGFQLPDFKETANLESVRSKLTQETKVRKLHPVKTILRVAAIVVLVVTTYLFLSNGKTTFSTEIAQRETFLLPDRSEVTMNALSEITFSEKDWEEHRNLDLKGEAYFKVEKGEKFSVHTDQGIVSVLGTQFNVYARDHQFFIKCFEGLVSVAYQDTLVKVPAGSYLKVQNNRLVALETTSDGSPSWIQFESTFENANLSTVLDELERQYPVKINRQITVNKKFTGSFTHKDLNVALRTICEPLQLEFKIAANEVMLYAKNSN